MKYIYNVRGTLSKPLSIFNRQVFFLTVLQVEESASTSIPSARQRFCIRHPEDDTFDRAPSLSRWRRWSTDARLMRKKWARFRRPFEKIRDPANSCHMSTMDIQAMQSMDWLFKKERIYLLAQFWQQVGASSSSNIIIFVLSDRGNYPFPGEEFALKMNSSIRARFIKMKLKENGQLKVGNTEQCFIPHLPLRVSKSCIVYENIRNSWKIVALQWRTEESNRGDCPFSSIEFWISPNKEYLGKRMQEFQQNLNVSRVTNIWMSP